MKKHLEFYLQHINSGKLPSDGLCSSIQSDLLKLFEPTIDEENDLLAEGTSALYWGFGLPLLGTSTIEKLYSFTPLRQTIILFCAAINNEL